MNSNLVYDLLTRLFHVLFSLSFICAFFLAITLVDDPEIFPYHMLLGLILGFLVLLRMIWGLIGSQYARFRSFPLHPKCLFQYGKDLMFQKTRRYAGHNPASSWAAVLMLLLGTGMVLSGLILVQSFAGSFIEDLHVLLAYAFLLTIIVHLVGLYTHQLKHQDGIGMSMLHGRKQHIEGAMGLKRHGIASGLLFLLLTMVFAMYLFSAYHKDSKRLNIFGSVLQLGEKVNANNEQGHDRIRGLPHEDGTLSVL